MQNGDPKFLEKLPDLEILNPTGNNHYPGLVIGEDSDGGNVWIVLSSAADKAGGTTYWPKAMHWETVGNQTKARSFNLDSGFKTSIHGLLLPTLWTRFWKAAGFANAREGLKGWKKWLVRVYEHFNKTVEKLPSGQRSKPGDKSSSVGGSGVTPRKTSGTKSKSKASRLRDEIFQDITPRKKQRVQLEEDKSSTKVPAFNDDNEPQDEDHDDDDEEEEDDLEILEKELNLMEAYGLTEVEEFWEAFNQGSADLDLQDETVCKLIVRGWTEQLPFEAMPPSLELLRQADKQRKGFWRRNQTIVPIKSTPAWLVWRREAETGMKTVRFEGHGTL